MGDKKYELEVGYSNGRTSYEAHETRSSALGVIVALLRAVTFPIRIVSIILKHPDGEVENFTKSPFDG